MTWRRSASGERAGQSMEWSYSIPPFTQTSGGPLPDRRTGKHREVDSASAHGLAVERWRVRQGASEGDEIGVGHCRLTGGRADPCTDNIH